jgi:hypothetical protein
MFGTIFCSKINSQGYTKKNSTGEGIAALTDINLIEVVEPEVPVEKTPEP